MLPSETLICGGGGGGVVALETLAAPGGGGAISIAGAEPAAAAAAGAVPNCCRTISLMRADKSKPQVGHANAYGLRSISGVASRAYFAPQSQMTFMTDQGLGLRSTTFVRSGRSNAAKDGDDRMLPSVNITLPPYL